MPTMSPMQNPNTFANYPLDKAGHRRRDKTWLKEALASESAQLALFQNGQPLCDERGALWLAGGARDAICGASALTLFLGVDGGGRAHFAADFRHALDESPIAGLGAFEDMRAAAARLPGPESAILGCAKSLFEWHSRHGFCANCGEASGVADGGWKRECKACSAEHFPRVDPVVIMLPVLGDRCCIGRQARWPRGMYSAFAGFVEPGESLEEACAREVKEETGLSVLEVIHHSTQPWPFPSSLMIGLQCAVADDVLELDKEELDEAVWITRTEARSALSGGVTIEGGVRVATPPSVAIAHQLVKAWAHQT